MFVSELHIVFKHSVKQKVNVGNMKKTVSTDGNKYLKKTIFFLSLLQEDTLYSICSSRLNCCIYLRFLIAKD